MSKSTVSFKNRDILGLSSMSVQEMELILDTAKEMKNIIDRDIKKVPTLRGKSIINLFFEASTRTRTSFELAGKYLGADVVNISASTSSVVKGESLRDTLLTVEAMGVDAIVMRHEAEGSSQFAAQAVSPVIINAGDGAHEHPTQGLLDMFTIKQYKEKLNGLKVAIIGDIMHSRVAPGPRTLLPKGIEKTGIIVHDRVEDALDEADVVNVLRIQLERQQKGLFPSAREYARIFGVNAKRLALAKPDALLMHPGPMNRGLEISPDVAYNEQSAIQEQVKNGLAGGRVINPADRSDAVADILIENGNISAIGQNLDISGHKDVTVYDASGLIVTPGLIDMHVHLREPGLEAKEDVSTGTRAAAAGGFTTVCCMPNTKPVIDSSILVSGLQKRGQTEGVVNLKIIGALSKGLEGKELAEIGDMIGTGAVAISDDGSSSLYNTHFNGELLSEAHAVGEVVFNTGMTGYQEILTDPSYCNQILTLTYPLIGNYGAAEKFKQSGKSFVRGLVISELCETPSNWESEGSLRDYLKSENILCLYNVDTRAVIRHVRSSGVMKGVIVPANLNPEKIDSLLKTPLSKDAVKKATTPETYSIPGEGPHVVVFDYGIKRKILNSLKSAGCRLTVVPADTRSQEVLNLNPEGIFLSNGPGNPKDVPEMIQTVKELIGKKPIFGICLGHQLLTLALGGDTYKLNFGHRGSNHPVKDVSTGRVYISSQNHGYVVDEKSLAGLDVVVTHVSMNDGTVEGLKHKHLPIFSVQYYPETTPGPDDNSYLFRQFIPLLSKN
ncbi:carbamoyltransferase family member [Holotrichia oblita]|nr:carbamoyltransferase family member [Holotrichia oblita]